MVYVMGWHSRTANLLDSGEAAQVFRGLGFTDVLKLDGGGSYYQSRGGAVSKTAENRRINSVLRWTVREEEPELTEDRVRQIVREELAVQESRLANAPADGWALEYIRQAVEAGILTGVDDGRGGVTIARPRAHTTRQELATMGVAILKAARK